MDEAPEASAAQGIADAAGSSAVGLEPSSAPGDSLSCSLDDERFNQLDYLHSSPDDAPESQSVLAGLTQIVQDACEGTESSDSPAVTSPAERFKTPDICMAESSTARKRVVDEIVTSDESRRARSRSWKVSRGPVSHVPPGVSSAALLARSRSTSASRSTSSSRSSSRK